MENETLKTAFPEIPPVIEVFPGVHATLMADYNRFSNGSFPLLMDCMTVTSKGKKIGEIGAAGGSWVFKVEEALYKINMEEAFNAVQNAHIASL
jgi:hypothetical protein